VKLIRSPDGNNCIVTALSNVRPHPNADRLKLATVFGTQVIVGLESQNGDKVLYFDSNLCLSPQYLHNNNLYAHQERNLDPATKGYFGDKGRVCAQKFRGEVSNGYVAPLESLAYTGIDPSDLLPGTELVSIGDHEICKKYIVPQQGGYTKRTQVTRISSAMFKCHWDTKQFMREHDQVPPGQVWIEEKVHGTSGRTGRVLVNTNRPWWKFWAPRQAWRVVSGTRRMDHIKGHIPEVREQIHNKLAPHLHKGETLYYEIFGYDLNGREIQKGFTYGYKPGEYGVLLYRVTVTTPDGFSVDLPRPAVYQRAIELGCWNPCVLYTGTGLGELKSQVGELVHGLSSLGGDHIMEGVVVWFMDEKGNWNCLKHKSEEFLMMESGQRDKDIGDVEDQL